MVRNRLRLLVVLIAFPFAGVLGRLASLQLGGSEEREAMLDRAQGRSRRIVLLPPRRGSILDHSGKVLARDETTFDLEFTIHDLHPRERYLSVLERSLDLCDDRCVSGTSPSGGQASGGCRGQVVDDHLHRVVESLGWRGGEGEGAFGSIADPVLIDHIPPPLRQRLHLRLKNGLAAMEAMVGVYFLPSGEGTDYEIRVRLKEALSMELTLQRISALTGEPYQNLRKQVALAEAEVLACQNETERGIARRQRRLLVAGLGEKALNSIIYEPGLYAGIQVVEGRKRVYPRGPSVAALTGYLRRPGQKELADGLILDRYALDIDFILGESFGLLRRVGSREGDDGVGARGLERYYDSRLRGAYGVQVEEIDAHKIYRRRLLHLPPEKGADVHTSIDIDLQEVILAALERVCASGDALAGSAAVMDLTGSAAPGGSGPPGALLAAAGYPTFDPNRMRSAAYLEEIESREKSFRQGILLDRPARAHLPPGSLFKLIVAAAAMEGGVEWPPGSSSPRLAPLDPATRYRCTHYLDPSNRKSLRCLSRSGHGQPDGEVDLALALQYSCNIYFYRLGRDRLQPSMLWGWASHFGFGRWCGVDIDDPAASLDAPAGILRQIQSQAGMCQYAIGHDHVTVSVLQAVRAVAGIALGGDRLPWPYFVAGRPPERLGLRPQTAQVLREGMIRVVHRAGGTANDDEFGLAKYRVAVKTGTPELKDGDPESIDPRDRPVNCAWMAGFAPYDRPEVAFAVLIERTPLHGGDAARVLEPILAFLAAREPEKYLMKPTGKSEKPEKPRKAERTDSEPQSAPEDER